jgi:hypothetical protein
MRKRDIGAVRGSDSEMERQLDGKTECGRDIRQISQRKRKMR